jgi:hypothetical protein
MRAPPQPAWVFVEPWVIVHIPEPEPPPAEREPPDVEVLEELGILQALMGR